MANITAKDFKDYIDDEFDDEILDLLIGVINQRKTFLSKMQDMGNPRMVVKGFQMNKQDLKEFISEGAQIQKPTKRRKIIEATSQPLGSEVVLMLHEIASNYKVKAPANKSWSSVANMVESVYLSIAKKDRASFIKDIQKLKTGTRNGEIIL